MLDRAETTLFRTFEKELLGPLARYQRFSSGDQSFKGLTWRHGFLHAARVRRVSHVPVSEVVRTVLEHPSGRFLRRLVLGRARYGEEAEKDLGPTFGVLARAPRTLDALVLGDGSTSPWSAGFGEVIDLDRLWASMPWLRSLVVAGSAPRLGTRRAEALEELSFSIARDDELPSIARAHWPKLQRLELVLNLPTDALAGRLGPLRVSEGLPCLRQLTLHRWMTSHESFEAAMHEQHEALAIAALRFAAARRLERLDLVLPLGDAARRLFEQSMVADIARITLPAEAIRDVNLRAAVLARHPNVELTEAPAEPASGELES